MTDPGAGRGPSLATPWRGLPPSARYVVVGVGLLLALNAGFAGLEAAVGRDPGGPASSSYATAPGGLAAYAELLEARGHPVRRIRTSLEEARLDPAATVVIADAPDISDKAADALGRFVSEGGRLVVTGSAAPAALRALPVGELQWSDGRSGLVGPIAPVPELLGVTAVQPGGRGSWRGAGATLPVLGGDSSVLVTLYASGRGRVVALADTSPWHNRLLDQVDNAAFALAAVGTQGRPVFFAEDHHGFGTAEGWAALPSRWKWAVAVAALAAVVAMWSQGRRFGPPEQLERELPPPRRAYVEAVATSLARTRQPRAAIRPAQEAARRALARRGGLPAQADDAAIRRAAGRLGIADADVDALVRPVLDDSDLLAVGRVLARVEREARP